jgi:hypothetical protein
MTRSSHFRFLALFVLSNAMAQAQIAGTAAQSMPAEIPIQGPPIPTRVLVQSPVETVTELQIVCLSESTPDNLLHGALAELMKSCKVCSTSRPCFAENLARPY